MMVLIIDDNESITEAVKDFFEFENIECKTVNEGRLGLLEIENQRFDLISQHSHSKLYRYGYT